MRVGRFELITHFDVCTESWFWEKLKIFFRGRGRSTPSKNSIVGGGALYPPSRGVERPPSWADALPLFQITCRFLLFLQLVSSNQRQILLQLHFFINSPLFLN